MSPLTFIGLVLLLFPTKKGGWRFKEDRRSLPYLSEPARGLELERNFVWRVKG